MISKTTVDLLTSFARFGREQRTSLRDPNTTEAFASIVKDTLTTAFGNDALLHGHRTQNMFEALIVSLGHYKMLKVEDTGTVHPEGKFTAPDFRVVLNDDTQWLIEVKNIYDQNPGRQRFRMTQTYLAELKSYAAVTGCELKLALYWARWGIWSLIDPSELIFKSGKLAIDMFTALRVNELAKLGDCTVGTKMPLRLRLNVDQSKPRTIGANGEVALTFNGATMFCANNEITDPTERNIAWILMQYGDWKAGAANPVISGNEVDAIEMIWEPHERANPHEDFELIGTWSTMFARYYASHTLEDGAVVQTEAELVPDWFVSLIKRNHTSTALPLWTFILEPNRKPVPDSAFVQ